MTRVQQRQRGKLGYSLVEVSLALLVVAIGLMTIFALIPDGLGLSRKSVDATEVSAFAEFVFASLDGMASSTNKSIWAQFVNDNTNLPVTHTLDGATDTPPKQPLIFNRGNKIPQLYYWRPLNYGDSTWGVEKYSVASFTYLLEIGQAGTTSSYARLEVWPSDVSNKVRKALADDTNFIGSTVFYREYFPLK